MHFTQRVKFLKISSDWLWGFPETLNPSKRIKMTIILLLWSLPNKNKPSFQVWVPTTWTLATSQKDPVDEDVATWLHHFHFSKLQKNLSVFKTSIWKQTFSWLNILLPSQYESYTSLLKCLFSFWNQNKIRPISTDRSLMTTFRHSSSPIWSSLT